MISREIALVRRRARILPVLLILTGSLFLGSESAAYRVFLTSSADGSTLAPGEKFTVEVHIDTEGDTGLVGLSVAVLHPPHVDYHQSESSYITPILYAPPDAAVPTETGLEPIGPNAPISPSFWPGNGGQVNVDFLALNADYGGPGQQATPSDELVARLRYEVLEETPIEIQLALDQPGNVFAVAVTGQPPEDQYTQVLLDRPVIVNPAPSVPAAGLLMMIAVAATLAFVALRTRHPLSAALPRVALAAMFVGLIFTPPIGANVGDIDNDGIPDQFDNCTHDGNGPIVGTCATQQDADEDGYGNACDTDVDEDGYTGLADFHATWLAIGSPAGIHDFDCSGLVDVSDAVESLGDAAGYVAPGPSGLSCAGTGPGNCPPI